MSNEGQAFERKSIRYVLDKAEEPRALAADCVGLANADGGTIHLGMEDGSQEPPVGQHIPKQLPEELLKRIRQLTVSVGLDVRSRQARNGGEYIEIQVFPTQHGIAATTRGEYYVRVADQTQRLLPDDLSRLWTDRGSLAWELHTHLRIPAHQRDPEKVHSLCSRVRASDRVSDFVKAKPDEELLAHYQLTKDGFLTNLGVLWVGRTCDRASLQHAPVIQCIEYNEREEKIAKWVWDDHSRTPLELIEAVWTEVPEWQKTQELRVGLFPQTLPHYAEAVVREVLVNALVHRPYTTLGDIFINLYPDRMEVHNPGRLPLGVTPGNILHASVQRNPHLARVVRDLKLMEQEGSGFDRMYEVLLSSGRPAPEVREGDDRVTVIIRKSIVKPEVIDLMEKVQRELHPTQRETIALGLLAQHESMAGAELARALNLAGASELNPWIERLRTQGLVSVRGRGKGTRYFVAPEVLRRARYAGRTSLANIEEHRLKELIIADLRIYGQASRPEIHRRIGEEIPAAAVRRVLSRMRAEGTITAVGERRWCRYRLADTAA